MKPARFNSKTPFALSIIFSVFLLFVFLVPKTKASVNQGPNDAHFSPNASYQVSTGGGFNSATVDIVLYFYDDSGSSQANQTVRVYSPDVCNPNASGSSDRDYQGLANNTNVTTFRLLNGSGNPTGGAQYGYRRSSSCNADLQFTLLGSAMTYISSLRMWRAYIRINLNQSNGNYYDVVNVFKIELTAGEGIVGTQANSNINIDLDGRLQGDGTARLNFATACNVAGSVNVSASWYDDDNVTHPSTIQPGDIYFYVERHDFDGNNLGRIPISGNSSDVDPGPISNSLRPRAGDGGTGQINFTVTGAAGYRYRWVWENVYDNNAIQFRLPFQSIYHDRQCQSGFNIDPIARSISVTPDDESPTGVTFNLRANVTIDGSIADNVHPVTVTRRFFILRGGVENPLPGSPFSGTSNNYTEGNHDYTQSYGAAALSDLRPGDQLCQRITVQPAAGTVDPTGQVIAISDASDSSPASCQPVFNKPYLKIYEGGAAAGIPLSARGCATPDNGGIKTAARGTTSANLKGSSAEYAVIAAEAIDGGTPEGFYSASQHGNRGGYLTFANWNPVANATTFAPNAQWGGNFGVDSDRCLPDYYNNTRFLSPPEPIPGPSIDASTLTSGVQYQYNGNLVISASQPLTQRTTIYVNGNVEIDGNIEYRTNDGDPNNDNVTVQNVPPFVTNVPYLTVIALGNIYIRTNVDRLSGLYIAQPTPDNPMTPEDENADTGDIFTCSVNRAPVPINQRFNTCHGANTTNTTDSPLAGSPDYASCHGGFTGGGAANTYLRGHALVIRGAFIARKVHLDRTNGTLRCGNTSTTEANFIDKAGETFILTPEFYLGRPLFRSTSGLGNDDFGAVDSYTALPPIF